MTALCLDEPQMVCTKGNWHQMMTFSVLLKLSNKTSSVQRSLCLLYIYTNMLVSLHHHFPSITCCKCSHKAMKRYHNPSPTCMKCVQVHFWQIKIFPACTTPTLYLPYIHCKYYYVWVPRMPPLKENIKMTLFDEGISLLFNCVVIDSPVAHKSQAWIKSWIYWINVVQNYLQVIFSALTKNLLLEVWSSI